MSSADQSDWVIDLGSPAPVISPEAQASLQRLAALSATCRALSELLPFAEQVDVLVRAAVAGGASEHHIAADLRIGLREARALARGQSFAHLFPVE